MWASIGLTDIHYLGNHPEKNFRREGPRPMRSRLRAPSSGIAPGWPAWLFCKVPLPFHCLPERVRLQVRFGHRSASGQLDPKGSFSPWMLDRRGARKLPKSLQSTDFDREDAG